ISIMLVFLSLVRNSVVLVVYLLFSASCFFTVHEHFAHSLQYAFTLSVLSLSPANISKGNRRLFLLFLQFIL
ncbi:MAG TPA: hypothetical protein DEB74_05030, partial [Lachnospiraceae bacterium]|nr:hypothetical protein [Lachnospiraceae bacterium]